MSWRFDTNPERMDMMPTRPRNMATHNVTFDGSHNSPVTPSDDPTVNRADVTSNINGLRAICGSRNMTMAVNPRKATMARASTVLARRTDPTDMVRS